MTALLAIMRKLDEPRPHREWVLEKKGACNVPLHSSPRPCRLEATPGERWRVEEWGGLGCRRGFFTVLGVDLWWVRAVGVDEKMSAPQKEIPQ